jgi:glycosyltransferase involved in cell wall biosynthesis
VIRPTRVKVPPRDPSDREAVKARAPGGEPRLAASLSERLQDHTLVSVIIPTHNYARYLPEAIESALAQNYSPLEIIVIDDGSTDATRVAVEAYCEQGVEYFYQENSGPGPARNEGIRRGRGEVVAFLDADDRWLPEKISLQMAHLRAHPELGLVGSAGFDCDSANRPIGLRTAPAIEAEMAFERLLVWNFVQPSGVIVPKRCLDEVGGFKNMRFGEDWDLWLRIAQQYPVGFVRTPLFMRREHPANLSLEVGERLLARYQAIAATHLHAAEPAWMRPVIKRRLRATAHFYAAGQALTFSRWRAARHLLSSLWLDPFSFWRAKLILLLRAVLPDSGFRWLRRLSRRPAGQLPERR